MNGVICGENTMSDHVVVIIEIRERGYAFGKQWGTKPLRQKSTFSYHFKFGESPRASLVSRLLDKYIN